MNMAADGEGAGAREINLDRLAGRLLVRVETHAARGDIDLMQGFVLVREENGVAGADHDLANGEGAVFLRDSVYRGGAGELRTGKESLFARVAGTISGRGH